MVYFTYPEVRTTCSRMAEGGLLTLFLQTSKITLEEVSIIFDGKHAVENDLGEAGQTKDDTRVEHREVRVDL